MITIIQVDTDEHIQQLQALLNEFMQVNRQLASAVGELSDVPTFQNIDNEIATLPGIFVPPLGGFFVALDDDKVIGCVALKPIDATTGELKRMYVTPGYRDQRVGWRLAETLVAAAQETGYTRLILDSHISSTRAQSVYQGIGFKFVSAPDDFPEFLKPLTVFMEMDLRAPSA